MTLLTAYRHDDGPKASQQRAAAEAANAALAYVQNCALSAGGITTATTTSQVKSVNTITFLVNGVFKSKAATDPLWTLSGTTVQASSFQKYALLLNASGTASIQEATQNTTSLATVAWTNVSNYSQWSPFLTLANAATTVVGVLSITTSSAGTFIPGTTLLGAAQVTAAFVDGIDQSLLPLIGNETGLIIGNF